MHICGVICEFNPFHNGHKYLLEHAAKNGDGVMCVMSGSVVQRGEAAVFDKWTRARAALENGADLVAELPTAYVLSSAERFAYGGIATLDRAGAESVVFGSEAGDISPLKSCADMLCSESDAFREKLHTLLSNGLSYPDALCRASEDEGFSKILSTPNNILGVEYLRAINLLNSGMKAITIKRSGAAHDEAPTGSSASGKALRDILFDGGSVQEYTPFCFTDKPRSTDVLSAFILGLLRTHGIRAFENIPDVCEGIENRILACAARSSSLTELTDAVKTRRYTRARLSRLLMNIMLGTDRTLAHTEPTYLRVLGLTQKGAAMLKQIKQTSELDIITKSADYCGNDRKLELDIRATDLTALCDPKKTVAGADFTTSPVIIS